MKKTLIALMALAGIACAADDTYTVTNTDKTLTNNYDRPGFAFNLSDSDVFSYTGTLEQTMQLTSIQVNHFRYEVSGGAYMLLLDDAWKVLAFSENSVTQVGSAEWDFSGVTLTSNSTYLVYFVDPTRKDALEVGDVVTNVSQVLSKGGGGVGFGTNGIVDYGAGTLTATSGIHFVNANSLGIDTAEKRYAPAVTFTLVPGAVPEPATATLSLLALAGLAARRRRH